METIDARKISRDAQEALRKRVIQAVSKGMTQVDASKIFGVSRTAIYHWIKSYESQGEKGLNKKRQGRPKESGKFKGWQAAWIRK